MKLFKNKKILITGGTGSFGMTFAKYLLSEEPKEIRIFSRDEKKQEDMRLFFNDNKLKFIIGDVRDYDSIKFATQNVDYVFHAAALKQVPTCEFYPIEAIKTNIIGAENVMDSSIINKVEKVVLLSTDKAVYPINAMGMTKAMMEKIMIAKSRINTSSSTIICATRYGNVLASRGSVIPLFINQIKESKPITITDPKMTRFLMFLNQSVDLVVYAFKHGNAGDIFVQKSPSARLGDLADVIKEIFNYNNPLEIIGTRHGEKLFETLISKEEMLKVKDLGNYYCIPCDKRGLDYNKYFIKGEKKILLTKDYTSHNTKILDPKSLKNLLLKLEIIKESI